MTLPGDNLPIRTAPGARWSCSGCGMCCRIFQLGPVEPNIIAGLRDRGVEADWEPAAAGPWFEARPGPDGPTYFLAKREGACVFLRPDNLCGIHALYGAEAKPGFCREFPFTAVEDAAGVAVVARPECAGLHHSFQTGEPVEAQAAAAVALPRLAPIRRFAPRVVELADGLTIPGADWPAVEREALTALACARDDAGDRPSPERCVAILRDKLLIAAGAPLTSPADERARMAVHATVTAFAMVMERLPPPPSGLSALEREFTAELGRLCELGRARLGDPAIARRAFSPEARAYLHANLTGDLLSKQIFAADGALAGLGLSLVEAGVARAATPGEGPVGLDEAGAVIPRWRRLLANQALRWVVTRARPALLEATASAR